MQIIVGLGNPGGKYKNTRHNIGFKVIDRLAELLGGAWEKSENYSYNLVKMGDYVLVKPETFMNRSGEAIECVIANERSRRNNLEGRNIDANLTGHREGLLKQLWIIHDDLDLPLGTVRTRFGGSSGGHNGLQSIIETLGTDQFWRIRVGIGRPIESETGEKGKGSEYVLSIFSDKEKPLVAKVISQTADLILRYLKKKYIVGETIKVMD